MSGLSLGTLLSTFKSVALTVFELLAFNAQKFKGSRDPGHAPFWINIWWSCPHYPRKHLCQIWSPYLTVCELLAFNSHDRPLRTDTHTQTHIERTDYLRHSLRSLGGDNYDYTIEEEEDLTWDYQPPSYVVHLCAATAASSSDRRRLRMAFELRIGEAWLQYKYSVSQRTVCAVTGAASNQDSCTRGISV